MSKFYRYDRINLFAMEIIALISSGHKEPISEIEKQMADSNLVNYIYDKYKENFSTNFGKDSLYDIESYNQFFFDMSSYVRGNESRKYGIVNEEDGLLLVVAVILDFLKCPKE